MGVGKLDMFRVHSETLMCSFGTGVDVVSNVAAALSYVGLCG